MLVQGRAPPVANYEVADPNLGGDRLNVCSWGEEEGCNQQPHRSQLKYVPRMAAGFGSHVAFTLYAKTDGTAPR